MNFIAGVVLLVLSSLGLGGDTVRVENRHVKFSLALSRENVQRGGTGEILITLRPEKGIHVNLQPAIELRLDSLPGVTLSGALQLRKLDTANYLDPSKPIRQTFAIAKQRPPGAVTMRGLLTYYYCSDAEGWCSRFKQPIAVTLTVRP